LAGQPEQAAEDKPQKKEKKSFLHSVSDGLLFEKEQTYSDDTSSPFYKHKGKTIGHAAQPRTARDKDRKEKLKEKLLQLPTSLSDSNPENMKDKQKGMELVLEAKKMELAIRKQELKKMKELKNVNMIVRN